VVNPEIPSVQKIVTSQIVAVTVYSDKALVTRRGIVSLTGQEKDSSNSTARYCGNRVGKG